MKNKNSKISSLGFAFGRVSFHVKHGLFSGSAPPVGPLGLGLSAVIATSL